MRGRRSGFQPSSARHLLCDLGQVISPLYLGFPTLKIGLIISAQPSFLPSQSSYKSHRTHNCVRAEKTVKVRLVKVRLVKAMVFPGVMDGCESWTIKKAENR